MVLIYSTIYGTVFIFYFYRPILSDKALLPSIGCTIVDISRPHERFKGRRRRTYFTAFAVAYSSRTDVMAGAAGQRTSDNARAALPPLVA